MVAWGWWVGISCRRDGVVRDGGYGEALMGLFVRERRVEGLVFGKMVEHEISAASSGLEYVIERGVEERVGG